VVVFFILLAYIILELILFAKGKSIGKAILGLQVVSSTDGKPFRFWKMFFRECFVKSASGSVLGLGYIWILIDEKNRGWHDKILDSYVVDLKESEKMNLRRHLEKARAEAKKPEPDSMPAAEPVPEVKEAEPVMPDVIGNEPIIPEAPTAEESVIEVTPEVVASEAVEDAKEEAETISDTETISNEEAAVDALEENGENKDVAVPETPELSMAMKKEELLEAARARGVQVSARATKAAIIEAIEKAEAETEE
jgi:hypothetical protein